MSLVWLSGVWSSSRLQHSQHLRKAGVGDHRGCTGSGAAGKPRFHVRRRLMFSQVALEDLGDIVLPEGPSDKFLFMITSTPQDASQ